MKVRKETSLSGYLQVRATVGYFSERIHKEPALGETHEKVALAVFLAFLVEGMSDEVNALVGVPGYRDEEGWKERLKMLIAPIPDRPDWGREPLQTVSKLFRIRNQLSHPKRVEANKLVDAPPPAAGVSINMDTRSANILSGLDPLEAMKQVLELEHIVFGHYGVGRDQVVHRATITFGVQ